MRNPAIKKPLKLIGSLDANSKILYLPMHVAPDDPDTLVPMDLGINSVQTPLALKHTDIGTVWTANAGSMTLDGTQSGAMAFRALVDADIAQLFPGTGTTMVWFRALFTTETSRSNQYPFCLGYPTSQTTRGGFYLTRDYVAGPRWKMYLCGEGGPEVGSTYDTAGPAYDTWANVAMVVSIDQGIAYLYINGVQSHQYSISTITDMSASASASYISVGNRFSAADSPNSVTGFDGQMRDFGIIKWASMPANITEIISELHHNNSQICRKVLQS